MPDPNKPFSVDTDACQYQIGAALFQEDRESVRPPIGFWSRTIQPAERNYSASERGCLAVIWAVQTLRPYLQGSHFAVFTDHSALKWMMNLTDPSGRLARWRLRLLEFDFTIRYRKGKENNVADAVSRLPTYGYQPPSPDLDIPCFLVTNTKTPQTCLCHHRTEKHDLLLIPLIAHYRCGKNATSLKINDFVDSESWTVFNWEPVENEAPRR